jgi:hypothetical protein
VFEGKRHPYAEGSVEASWAEISSLMNNDTYKWVLVSSAAGRILLLLVLGI